MFDRRFAIAPMMDWTDRHCRFFHRLLTRRALLYTEMLTTGAVIHGDRARLLGYSPQEHPLALQLGGSEPQALAACARIGADAGYDEINLNVGCPSDRVQEGRFGACLMAEPALVGDCIAAMKAAVDIPVTVKCRIGIDEQDPEAALDAFVAAVAAAGADAIIVHARKAWLKGLSPRENREVPPLDYSAVCIASRRPIHLSQSCSTAALPASKRRAQRLARSTASCSAAPPIRSRGGSSPSIPSSSARRRRSASAREAVEALMPYAAREVAQGTRLSAITRHVIGLFHAVPGARAFRRHLATQAVKPGAGVEVVEQALAMVGEIGQDFPRTAAA